MDEIALKIYRVLAVVVVIGTGIYFWWDISSSYDWLCYLLVTPTFDLGKLLLFLSFCMGIGALFGHYETYKISDVCGTLFSLLLFSTFLFDPYYEYIPRGMCIWAFYMLLGGSLSALALVFIEYIDDWLDTNGGSDKTIVRPAKNVDGHDALLIDVARDVIENGTASSSYVQRNYQVGFNRAGRIMDQLEKAGVVSEYTTNLPRKVLLKSVEELDNIDFKQIFKEEEY